MSRACLKNQGLDEELAHQMDLGFSDTCGDSHRNEEVRSTFEFLPGGIVRSQEACLPGDR